MEWALLEGVPEEVRRRVLAGARLRRFARGEVVFHEGDPGDTLHLIAKGRVAIRVATALGDTATLAVLGAGDFFGELALLEERPRTASVVALEKTETMALHRDDFDEMANEFPSVHAFLVHVLGAQVRRLTGQVMDALYVPAEKRVLRRLGELARVYGNGDGEVVIPLTQEDLATMAGTSRATVNRVLGDAEKAGIVAVGRMKISVVDRAALDKQGR
ncbi:MAG: Crp/Fnr family transcriptional regulator [Actinomycetota bacterium]